MDSRQQIVDSRQIHVFQGSISYLPSELSPGKRIKKKEKKEGKRKKGRKEEKEKGEN